MVPTIRAACRRYKVRVPPTQGDGHKVAVFCGWPDERPSPLLAPRAFPDDSVSCRWTTYCRADLGRIRTDDGDVRSFLHRASSRWPIPLLLALLELRRFGCA